MGNKKIRKYRSQVVSRSDPDFCAKDGDDEVQELQILLVGYKLWPDIGFTWHSLCSKLSSSSSCIGCTTQQDNGAWKRFWRPGCMIFSCHTVKVFYDCGALLGGTSS